MPLNPLYCSENLRPAFQLRYSWTGWLKSAWRDTPDSSILDTIEPLWEQDGLRHLEHSWASDHFQITFIATPDVSPVLLATRAKGRLQHALRNAGRGFPGFTRKVSVRSIGENTSQDVEAYIASQVEKASFDDPRFCAMLAQFTSRLSGCRSCHAERVSAWTVLVQPAYRANRGRPRPIPRSCATSDALRPHVADRGQESSQDRIDLPDAGPPPPVLRGNIDSSPLDIALGFQNNLAFAMGQVRIWQEGFYSGTFSEYDMGQSAVAQP